MAILHFLSYGAALAAFLFVTLSVASGLLWISELIEEHSKLAKSVGIRGIYVIIAIHFVLYFTDGLPLAKTLFSVFCHIVYLQNFSNTWPVISLTSLTFIASCILVIADHFLWFFYFAAATQQARHNSMGRIRGVRGPSFGDMSTFFAICVWLAPLFLFLSLSANDNALPTNAGIPASPTQVSHFADLRAPAQPRTSLFRSLLLPLNYLPRLRGKQPRNEGIIAPPSPVPSRPSSPLHMTATLNNLPPTSPRPASFDGQSHLTPDFRLRPPVRRGASSDDITPPPPSTEAYKMR